ncbi:uncharacterized protein [Nothobranchius furzeri]|uniref:uncharacterized protein n=1 Tax=Nothobranchius furzeri TaxID=105023 RepID=UPI003904B5E6
MTRPPEGSSGEILPWKYLFQFFSADYRPASPSPAPAPPRRRRRPRPSASAFLAALPEPDGTLEGEMLRDRSSFEGTRLAFCSPGVGPRRGERRRNPPQPCASGRSCEPTAGRARRASSDTSPVRPAVPSPAESASAGGGAALAALWVEHACLQVETAQVRQTIELQVLQLDDLLAELRGLQLDDLLAELQLDHLLAELQLDELFAAPAEPAVPPPVHSAPLSSVGGGATPTVQPTELASQRAELVRLQQSAHSNQLRLDALRSLSSALALLVHSRPVPGGVQKQTVQAQKQTVPVPAQKQTMRAQKQTVPAQKQMGRPRSRRYKPRGQWFGDRRSRSQRTRSG